MVITINHRIYDNLTAEQLEECRKELLELRNGLGRNRIEAMAQLTRYGFVFELPNTINQQLDQLLG